MLSRIGSIRTTLTFVGLHFRWASTVVGRCARALTGAQLRSGVALRARATATWSRIAHSATTSGSYLLRSRMTLDRVRSLAGGRQHRRSEEGARSRPVPARQDRMKTGSVYLDTPKTDAADRPRSTPLSRSATRSCNDGVNPEFAAIRANDMAGYHAIADTKISPMFVAFDNGRLTARRCASHQEHAERRARHRRRTSTMLSTIDRRRAVLAVLMLIAHPRMARPDRAADQRCRRSLRPHLARRSHAVRAYDQDQSKSAASSRASSACAAT